MNPVFWFEIPANDANKLSEFYKKAFGWNPIPVSSGPNAYIVVQTAETDKDGMIKENNRINGGIYQLSSESAAYAQRPNIVLATDDIEKSVKDVQAAGGKVLQGPYEIPNYGTYFSFLDPEGNRAAVMKPKMP